MYLKIYINLLPCIAVTGANFTWHLTQLKPHGLLQRQSSNARNLFVGVFPKVWTFSRFGYQLDHSFSLYCPVFEYHIKYSLRDWCTCFSFRKYQMTHSFSYDTYFLSVCIVGEKNKKKNKELLIVLVLVLVFRNLMNSAFRPSGFWNISFQHSDEMQFLNLEFTSLYFLLRTLYCLSRRQTGDNWSLFY